MLAAIHSNKSQSVHISVTLLFKAIAMIILFCGVVFKDITSNGDKKS